ncbi:alanine--tRNA ligase [Lagierella sp.]|uniref:alanine--tRNA ligase n=1 Tax=Lagierella sp. TaxID=2849657 RepID=UPI0026259CBD|nr:alanine--tRNA ligase [Lagierella sp.]
MKNLGLNEIRSEFLEFFREKDHNIIKSFSLIPTDDDSLLLINAGMAPLKKYFTGEFKMPGNRAASSQRCIRTADIESVGITKRHGTFFEMLGNFSFGNYFKKEAISWAWEFLTERLELPKDKLWISVYEKDDEAYDIWKNIIKIPEERIVRLGKEDNFWELEEGPCGPCSEIHVDRGEEMGCDDPDCKPGCDCDRFLEVWNLVFTQFYKDSEGNYSPLENPNIDTGMGLERITMVMENADNIFEINLVKDIISKIEEISNVKYKNDEKTDISIRIIADHVRAMTFLVYDGIIPSNEGRGYVLRRIIRRASRHGKLLGIKESFLTRIVDKVLEIYNEEYPELLEDRERINKIIASEESKFQETIDQGLSILESLIENLKKTGGDHIKSEEAFKLYDTYGFPVDLTLEILRENNMSVDLKRFDELLEEQRIRSRESRHEGTIGWSSETNEKIINLPQTNFVGYNNLQADSSVKFIFREGLEVDHISEGEKGIIVTETTPFYGEGGGQVGDIGEIISKNSTLEVLDTKKNKNNGIYHHVLVKEGDLKVGDSVTLKVNEDIRHDITKNHTATHLLHKALREVLGNHVHQAGSYVGPNRLRFDITHFETISREDLEKVQDIVNSVISKAMPVNKYNMTLKESEDFGAIGLFEDKYKDIVRVVSVGDKYSTELCGGCHVNNTAEIQMLQIISESSVAAGVRRIEAITGKQVYKKLKENNSKLKDLSIALKTDENDLVHRSNELQNELKSIEKELNKLKQKDSLKGVDEIIKKTSEVNGIKYLTHKVENMDIENLRNLGDTLKDKLSSGVVVLANSTDDKINFLTLVTKDLAKKTLSAGNIVKKVAQITGGNGGGRPDFAMAGGKDPSKVDEALSSVENIIEEQMK